MTNLTKIEQELPQRIVDYCEEKGTSQQKLAAKAGLKGISPALVSKMVNGDFTNISDEKKLIVWDVVKPEGRIYDTEDVASGLEACMNARIHHRMIAIEASEGMSKTTILERAARQKNTYYVYIDGTVTPGNFLRYLLKEMGVSYEGSLNDMVIRIAQELNSQNNPLLLIDECAKLTDKMLLILHSLRDRTKNNCGIVLAGMPDFRNKLIKFSNKGKTGYAEFKRRIQIWHELQGISRADKVYILKDNKIDPNADNHKLMLCKNIGELLNAIELYKEINAMTI